MLSGTRSMLSLLGSWFTQHHDSCLMLSVCMQGDAGGLQVKQSAARAAQSATRRNRPAARAATNRGRAHPAPLLLLTLLPRALMEQGRTAEAMRDLLQRFAVQRCFWRACMLSCSELCGLREVAIDL